MSATHFMDTIPLFGVLVGSLIITFLSIEIGVRFGKRRAEQLTGEEKINTGPFATATLSLLAFMLAIVFGAAESRFSEIKRAVLDEANAIGSAFVRADLLPEPERTEVRKLLYGYVNLLVEGVQTGTREQLERTIDQAEAIQNDLWSIAIDVADQQPTPIPALLFVQSLNDVFDLHETRITLGVHYRLPGVIWVMLYGLAVLALALGGYEIGVTNNRRLVSISLLTAIAFSVVILLEISLDRPHQYVTSITQAAMLDTQEDIHRSMQAQP